MDPFVLVYDILVYLTQFYFTVLPSTTFYSIQIQSLLIHSFRFFILFGQILQTLPSL